MVTATLCRSFHRLNITATSVLIPKPNYSTLNHQTINGNKFVAISLLESSKSPSALGLKCEPNLRLSALPTSTIDLNVPIGGLIQKIIDSPSINNNINNNNNEIIDPLKIRIQIEDKVAPKLFELPAVNENLKIEKQAARLVVIRRRKMRRHKLRKLRKRMKFVFRKQKHRRVLRKEKAFHAELLAKIDEANKFDAKEYVASRLKILDHVRIPTRWKGEILPEDMIRQFMKEEEERRLKVLNRPRLKLD
ncbi:uncharacterized protein LOC103579987 [Microplitis demolitor]|uniref:uncharacterized protein LOC103579987 n=1 Tax=Microplitis demolitor TaxID=69319 RepID=UPI0004CCE075|nr:uncharacterized protein LOC103579987 [Microplitis demolitor]